MATVSLLIADDNAERAAALLERVKSDSWSVAIAPTAEAACTAIDANPIAVVLADAAVWHDKGLGAFASAKHPALPVIVLTARGEASPAIVQQLQLGVLTFVPRDAGRRRLVETIQSLLDITRHNPYRERVRTYLRSAGVELHIGNDPGAVAVVVGYLQRILEDYGLSNDRERFRVGLALSEAILNAVIHGNLEVASDLRDAENDSYYETIEEKRRTEPFASRIVQISTQFSQSTATFVIRDQGPGFDRSSLPDPTDPANLLKPSGRGVLMMRAYTDLVTWNEIGNEVTLVKGLTA